MRRAILLAPALALALTMGCEPPKRPQLEASPNLPPFSEVAAAAGLDFTQRTGKGKSINIIQTSAGGCGVLDYDGDGRLDIYLVQGQHGAGPGSGNRLYRNQGGGKFQDVTEQAGVRGRGYGMGCAVGDFDADGYPDLYVCNNGESELYRNRGNGTFEPVGERLGAAVPGCSVGAVFADLDRDGWPDLYVVRYIEVTAKSPLICQLNGVPTSCGPALYAPQAGVFLKNDRGRRFVDATREFRLKNPGRGMAAIAADLSGDARLDLFVANDTTANAFFVRAERGFEDKALLSGIAYGDLGAAEANMGADVGDFDGDGRVDLWVGVMQDRMSLLFRNEGNGFFRFFTREAGLAEATANVVTFGGGFLDYDNDGDLDLFQANGHVHDHIHEVDSRLVYPQPRQLFENSGGGSFRDVSAAAGPALTAAAAGRGAAFGDLDNDGDVDVLVNNLDGPPTLLLNHAERLNRHWLTVRLAGKHPNLRAEGAELELTVGSSKLLRLCHSAYSYASANDPRVYFGLGSSTSVGPLRVRWPDGMTQQVNVPRVDTELVVTQAGGAAKPQLASR